jgi:uncharacterized repeat protein (TIGR01451 family)
MKNQLQRYVKFFHTKFLILVCLQLFFGVHTKLCAQGTVTFVTPNSGQIGQTVTLHLTGTNTQFTQATTSLHNSTSGLNLLANNLIIHNDSSMQADFNIPLDPNYIGLWNVLASGANSLIQGFEVTSNKAVIQGRIYYDMNGDCIKDAGEDSLYYRNIVVQPGNIYATVDQTGYYSVEVPLGFYAASVTFVPYGWETINCPASGTRTVNVASNTHYTITNQDFAVSYIGSCERIKTTVAGWNMRPCFNHGTYVHYNNFSPYTANNVIVTATLDSYLTPVTASPAWSQQTGNTLTFNIGTLAPMASGTIYIADNVSCSAPLGDTLCIEAYATSSQTACMDSSYNYFKFCKPTTSSLDPNDKQTIFPRTANISAGDELTYMIRFQNTGTDTAFKVVVIDSLPNDLDPSSFIAGVSSFPFKYAISGHGVIKFTFDNIMLPDSSVNQAGSHGFVTFSIRQKPNNQPGTQIKNTAGIYFDYNPPVITNTTLNEIPFPVVTNVDEIHLVQDGLSVYPNPFKNSVRFTFMNKDVKSAYSIMLYDITGKIVKEIKNITGSYYDMEKENLSPQVYIYKIYDREKQVHVGKLIMLSE